MLKLLIAEESEEVRIALTERLSDAYIIRICCDGKQTLEMMYSLKPDVMLLDLMLPELDGVSLLQRATEAGMCPVVLATSRFFNDYILERLTRLGVGYVLKKPYDIEAATARLADLTQNLGRPVFAQPDIRTVAASLLLKLGVSTKLRGYTFLRDAVLEQMRNPGCLVTKELYPSVGKPYHANAVQVERAIRSAIEKAWERRDDQTWQLYFPADADGRLRKPTNAAFISRLAIRLALSRDGDSRISLPEKERRSV